MNEPFNPEEIRVYVGTDRSQMVGVKVLEYSIAKHTQRPFRVIPMLDLGLPDPKDIRQAKRTGFSFNRFAIPRLAGFQGKAIYMDADMQVFSDIGDLWDIPFNGKKMLIQQDIPDEHVNAVGSIIPRKRIKQCAVSLLDCENLQWNPEEIIAGLDGKYTYEELMFELCILDESEVGYTIPFEWNSLEHWDENTKNIHYTDMHSQPWVSPINRFGWVWINEVKEMLENNALTWEELEEEVRLGYARPSLLTELKLEEDLKVPSKERVKMLEEIDKEAGFMKHKAVYEAKKARKKAEQEYLNSLNVMNRVVHLWYQVAGKMKRMCGIAH